MPKVSSAYHRLGSARKPGLDLAPDQFEVDTVADHRGRGGLAVEGAIGPDFEQRALDPFAGVVATWPALWAGAHALGVENTGRGPVLAPLGQTQAAVEHGERAIQHPTPDPAFEAAADGLARRADRRQQAPGGTGTG